MGNIVWYCSVCGDGPIGSWVINCSCCGHVYCGACHTDVPYVPGTVQDETKGQDFERPSTTSYPLSSESRLTIPDRTATPTDSLVHLYEDSEPLSHDRADAVQKIPHTISPGQTLSEQDDPRSEEAIPMDGPSNPLSRLSPTDGSSSTRADNEDVSESYASSRMSNILSSESDFSSNGVAFQYRYRAATPLDAETNVASDRQDSLLVYVHNKQFCKFKLT